MASLAGANYKHPPYGVLCRLSRKLRGKVRDAVKGQGQGNLPRDSSENISSSGIKIFTSLITLGKPAGTLLGLFPCM